MAHSLHGSDHVGPLFDLIRSPRTPWTFVEMPADERALDRILNAVGKNFTPANLNRGALWTAITKAKISKENIGRLRGPHARAIVTSMKNVSKAAKSLKRIIKENGNVSEIIGYRLPSAMEEISRLVVVSDEISQNWSKDAKIIAARYKRPPSPREWLAGVELPLIFEECFGRKASLARTGDVPSGPTVRFISAAMSEMDRPPADETIVRAMTRFSEIRKRRRVVRQRDNNIGQK
jgi:hypothetical protein